MLGLSRRFHSSLPPMNLSSLLPSPSIKLLRNEDHRDPRLSPERYTESSPIQPSPQPIEKQKAGHFTAITKPESLQTCKKSQSTVESSQMQ